METYIYETHNQNVSSNYLLPSTLSPSQDQTKIEEISLPDRLTYPKRYIAKMMLNCSVLGTGVTVSVPLSKVVSIKNDKVSLELLTVDCLKKYIWEREKNILEDLTNDPSDLSLWNVNVDEVKDVSTENDIIRKLGGKKMIPRLLFSFYFRDKPPAGKIHIIVQPPATGSSQQACAFTLTADDIVNILDPYVGDPPNPLHDPMSKFNDIPDDVPDISAYLKFVGREEEIKQLMSNMERLYYLVNRLNEYQEPIKEISFPTAVGMAGKGKTTFARRAYDDANTYSEVNPNVTKAVEECRKAGRNFRIACDDISAVDVMNPEMSFGIFMLYEALKYRLNTNIKKFVEFSQMFRRHTFALETILEVILRYSPCEKAGINFPLFIINIDETNALFDTKNEDCWLQTVLRSLSRCILKGYFLFVVLSGTHAIDLFDTVKSSNAKFEDISLSLLESKHAEEVIFDLANRVVDKTERIDELSVYLKYIIDLLGVVGRFLETMIFQMGIIGSDIVNKKSMFIKNFYQRGLRYFLQKCQYDPKLCQELLEQTKEHINRKYQHYFDHFKSEDNREIMPLLVAYTLFGWPVERTETIGINKKRKIGELEKEELIFLDRNKRIKLPFLTLHEIYSHRNSEILPNIKILESLDNAMSLDQNEMLTISVLVFRLWAIYQRSIIKGTTNPCRCKLSQLVPLRHDQEDVILKFLPIFKVNLMDNLITEKNWDQFVRDIKNQPNPECIAYQNRQKAKFADSFLLTDPPILIQSKQSVISRNKVIEGYSSLMLEEGLVKKDHDKCRAIGEHIFLFVTDCKRRYDETYDKNEIVITKEEEKFVFGDLLAVKKLLCIERA